MPRTPKLALLALFAVAGCHPMTGAKPMKSDDPLGVAAATTQPLLRRGDWPQWRGPTRDGFARESPFPDSLQGERLQVLWRVTLAEGYASPLVTADRVFVAETRDRQKEIVRALDRVTGRELWATDWAGSMKVPFFAASNGSWVRGTPAYDGRWLYVPGMRDVLICLDGQNGAIRWQVDFVQRYKTPLPAFGFVSSPLVVGEHVYVQAGASFVKLDKHTGKEVWRALADVGGMWGSAFSSPMLATLRGQEQILVQSRNDLAGVDPQNGRVLWTTAVQAFRGMNILNPTAFGDLVFTSSYGGSSLAFDVREDANGWSARPAWQIGMQGYMSTPVVIDGHAYLHRRDGRFSCVDLAAGKEKWTSPDRYGQYWSLATDGKRILALDQRGELLLLRANPEKFELLDARRVATEQTWAHVAVCGDEVFVRELKAVAAYRWH
jgi:outer membrane protein assembly factor BamB